MPRRYGGIKKSLKKSAQKVYSYAKKYVPKGTARKSLGRIGESMGNAYGVPQIGRQIGEHLGTQFANITGVGSYYTNSGYRRRNIMNPRTSYQPRVEYSDEDIIFSNTEYVTDLFAGASGTPTEFNIDSFDLNPGLDVEANNGLFAWLPQIASGYSQYKFMKCVIEYRSKSGDSTGANTALGSVFMSANYSATDDAPTSKGDMLNSQYAVSTTPAKDALFPIECNPRSQNLKMHQIRTKALKSNQNQDLFDMAKIFIATQGIPTTGQLLGEIHITYQIKFSKKKVNDKSNEIRSANYRWTGAAGQGPTSAYPLGQSNAYPTSQPTAPEGNNLPLTINASNLVGPQYIQFPEYMTSGIFLVGLRYRSAIVSAITWSQPGWSFSNCALESCLFSPQSAVGQYSAWNNQQNTTPTTLYFSNAYIIRITGQNARISFDGTGTLDTDIVDFQILVTELNPETFGNGI